MLESFAGRVMILGSATGLHLAARFAGVDFTQELLTEIEQAGVRVYPAEAHAVRAGRLSDTLVIGYGNLGEGQIERGVRILKEVLSRQEIVREMK